MKKQITTTTFRAFIEEFHTLGENINSIQDQFSPETFDIPILCTRLLLNNKVVNIFDSKIFRLSVTCTLKTERQVSST